MDLPFWVGQREIGSGDAVAEGDEFCVGGSVGRDALPEGDGAIDATLCEDSRCGAEVSARTMSAATR